MKFGMNKNEFNIFKKQTLNTKSAAQLNGMSSN